MKTSKFLSALLSALLVLTALPLSFAKTAGVPPLDFPEGYNVNDYMRCVDFLEQTDENGVKNGQKMAENYDPNDPYTWGSYTDDQGNKLDCFRFEPDFGGEYRLVEIKANRADLIGTMDLTGCAVIETVNCVQNRISGMVVEGCAALEILNFLENEVSEVDLSTNPNLVDLGTADNPIAELDISNNPLLHNLFAGGGRMTELDLSNNPRLPMQRIYAEGNGSVGYMYLDLGVMDILALYNAPFEGAVFEGWYTVDGQLVDASPDVFQVPDPWMYDVLIARYSGGDEQPHLPGDVDGDGAVTVMDALLAMRCGMGLIELDEEAAARADFDGSGGVTISDAVLILRAAMGIN